MKTINNGVNSNNQDKILEVIQVENLRKEFNGVTALDGISFTVKRGEIFGFLGPNGAGKTTTINILSTLLLPTSGIALVNGYNVLSRPDMVRKSIGLVFQEITLDTHLTAEENLYLHALLYGVPRKEFIQRKREVLKLCELWTRRKSKVDHFSGGMKRRLEIARALIHWPAVLFLDEPTIGLDPQTRTKIWDYIFTTRKQHNTTIFLTTQYLNEAEKCDRIAIIDQGKIIALDAPDNLKRAVGGDVIVIRTENNDVAEQEILDNFPECKIRKIGKELRLEVASGDEFLPTLIKSITPEIITVNLRRPTLDDVFLQMTGRQMREAPEVEVEPIFDLAGLLSIFIPSKSKKSKNGNKKPAT